MSGVKEAWAKLRGGEIKYGCKEGISHFVASNLIKTGTWCLSEKKQKKTQPTQKRKPKKKNPEKKSNKKQNNQKHIETENEEKTRRKENKMKTKANYSSNCMNV